RNPARATTPRYGSLPGRNAQVKSATFHRPAAPSRRSTAWTAAHAVTTPAPAVSRFLMRSCPSCGRSPDDGRGAEPQSTAPGVNLEARMRVRSVEMLCRFGAGSVAGRWWVAAAGGAGHRLGSRWGVGVEEETVTLLET